MNYNGQLDLTRAGIIARRHPELVKHVKFNDGIEHMLLDVSLFSLQKPDKIGNTVTLKVRCKKDEQIEGVNYYLGNFKDNDQSKQQQPATQQEEDQFFQPPVDVNDLPF